MYIVPVIIPALLITSEHIYLITLTVEVFKIVSL